MIVAGATHSFSSTHFTIYWGDNIPYTTTWADYNSNGTPDFPEDVASILENAWQKEVGELKFHKPFSDHISVYVGNTGIWIDGTELKVGDNVCGYAIYNGTNEYIVVNDYLPTSLYTKPKDILKITLAHEFFHLIQYTYSLSFDELNAWLYEGTAVWMEHIVYPEIDDYIYSYASSITNAPNYGLLYPNGLQRYGASLFFDYLSNRYGNNVIKDIWQDMNSNALKAIDSALNDYNTTLKKEIHNFYYSLENNLSAFSNEDSLAKYPVKKEDITCDKEYEKDIYTFGALYTQSSCKQTSFFDKNPKSTFSYDKQNIFIKNSKDMSIVYPNTLDIDKGFTSQVGITSKDSEELDIKKGWNLVSLKNDINITKFSNYPIDICWVYQNDKWGGYATDKNIQKLLKEYNLTIQKVNAQNGIWIKAQKEFVYDIDTIKDGCIEFNLSSKWNLLANPSFMKLDLATLLSHFSARVIWIWKDSQWQIYTDDDSLKEKVLQLGYNFIDKVNTKGFWIEK